MLVADSALEYRDDAPIAVVEAKRTSVDVAAGIEQAKRYAIRLGLPAAYATDGLEIWEIESRGNRHKISRFPSPEELWTRHCDDKEIASNLERTISRHRGQSSLMDRSARAGTLGRFQFGSFAARDSPGRLASLGATVQTTQSMSDVPEPRPESRPVDHDNAIATGRQDPSVTASDQLSRWSETAPRTVLRWGGWDSNPRPTDYESAALTG